MRDKHKISVSKKVKISESPVTNDNDIVLPCDACDYIANSASDFIEHIDVHQKSSKKVLKCDKCDYESQSNESLKAHLVEAHIRGKNINTPRDTPLKTNRPCLFYAKGYCKFSDSECKYLHDSPTECRFQ